jgi:hypothetical protein
MSWYWWIPIVILGLNAFAIAMLGAMMIGDWFAQRRAKKESWQPHRDDPSEN